MRKLLLLTLVGALIMAASVCWAGIPHLIHYQGMLTGDTGNPINEPRDLTFTIYDAPTNGTALWTETHTAVSIENGLFNVILGGETTTIPDSVFDAPERYLGIKVGTDPELAPRIQLSSVGYAYRAAIADHAEIAGTAETDGDWNIDGYDMYSAVSGMVGIGTVTPPTTNTMLHVDATAHMDPTVGILVEGVYPWAGYFSGNVYAETIGIGTTSPDRILDVNGHISLRPGIYGNAGIWLKTQAGVDEWYIGRSSTASPNQIGFYKDDWVMVIEDDKRVGIGTPYPERNLHIVGDNPRILIEASSISPEINFKNTGDPDSETWALYKHGTTDDFRFYQNGDKVTIKNGTGNVGIGITDPSEKIDVNGTARLRGISSGGGTQVYVDGDGKLWKQTSSLRYKQNIRELNINPQKFLQLEPVRFEWKTTGEEDIGLIAEDVENVIPDLVIYDNEGRPDGVKYDKIAIYLLGVVKNLKSENEELKKRIEALESRE
ncbi:MAG: tail fiber domain-containing protein [Candidatus Zixiibacteriota bacterium]